MAAKGARNRIGWAVQLGTVRYLGTFLDNPEQVPSVVVDYVAEQLGLDPAEFAGYGTKEARWDHQEQIRTGTGTRSSSSTRGSRWPAGCTSGRGSAPSARPCCSTWPPSAWSLSGSRLVGGRSGGRGRLVADDDRRGGRRDAHHPGPGRRVAESETRSDADVTHAGRMGQLSNRQGR